MSDEFDRARRVAVAVRGIPRDPGVRAIALLRGIPGFAGRLKPVANEHWTETPMGCLVACPCGDKPALQTGRFHYCGGCHRFYLFDGVGLWVTYGLPPDRRCRRCGEEIPTPGGHCGDCRADLLMDVEHEEAPDGVD